MYALYAIFFFYRVLLRSILLVLSIVFVSSCANPEGQSPLYRNFSPQREQLVPADIEEIASIESIGPVIAGNVVSYFSKEENSSSLDRLLAELHIEAVEESEDKPLSGFTFVITGSVTHFSNRSEMKEKIESLGGKVTGSVTKKTNYLINNDTSSGSSKNKKAAELGIPVISEEQFLSMIPQ